MNIADFFADNFVSNLAFVLGIDIARIKVVSVKAGSVKIDWEVSTRAILANPCVRICGKKCVVKYCSFCCSIGSRPVQIKMRTTKSHPVG
jgi:hypothetical protein